VMKAIFEAQQEKSLQLRSSTIAERKEKLRKVLQWIYTNRDDIAAAVYADLGKDASQVELTEILPVTTEIKLALRNLHKWTRQKRVPTSIHFLGTKSYIKYEPKGTNLIIAPWNYPFNLTLSPLVSAIAAGNTAIIKPSERIRATTKILERLTSELFDLSEITVIKGGITETQELLKLPFDHIFFTGSPGVGKIIMQAAAKHLTSVTLELGGKSPAIIDETANIKDAAKKLSWGKFTNCGQTCIAPDYILVHQAKYNALQEALISSTHDLYNSTKKGFQDSAEYSRIIDEKHVSHLKEMLEEATTAGAKTIMGGENNIQDKFFSPTLLSDVPQGAKLLQEEIFGPLLPLIPYSTLDEAIDLINSKPKPLALYLFTQSARNQRKIIQRTSSGGVNINDNLIQFANNNLPFGGINNSGLGNSHGYHGFQAFSNEKAIMKQRVGFTTSGLFHPPYSGLKKKLIRWIVRYL
jgi:aldehyde dehydrogenase (NAD+)